MLLLQGTYVFYLQLITDLFQLFVYMIFFLIICAYYGLPFHIVRDLYVTYSNFKKRITQYLQYRRLTRLLQTFPDATEEEIASGDATCIICRDDMTSAKKLPCGHIYHHHCLRTWLETQETCPYCRAAIVPGRAPAEAAGPAAAAAAAAAVAAPPQAAAVENAGPMPEFHMPPAAGVADARHAAAVGPAAVGIEGAAFGMQAGGGIPGVMPMSFGHPGMGGVPLNEEMLKVHIEWQIESLQHLLGQIEARHAKKAEGEVEGDSTKED